MIASDFARFAVFQRERQLPKPVEEATTRAVIDWFAAAASGAATEAPTILRDSMIEPGSTGFSMLIGDPRQVSAVTASLINGVASHAVEFDDIYRDGIYHPGSPTVAAALAAGQRVGCSGADLLRAVAVGYEVGDHVAAAINPAHYRFWHTTGTVGTIGAAAAVAELLRLDVTPFAHALAMATTMAAGLQQSFRSDSMAKPLHAGHAAQCGVIAGFAAEKGFTGALDIFEGNAGFGQAMSETPDWAEATKSLGSPWLIQQPTVKVHSCCGHTFAAIDCALELREAGVDISKIRKVNVATYKTAVAVAGIDDPTTAAEARFSTAYVVASALCLGSVRLRAFEPNSLHDPSIRSLVRATELSVDEQFESQFPHRRAARVTLTFEDGGTQVAERLTRRGDPDDPVSVTELEDKFRELVAPLYGAEPSEALLGELRSLARTTNVRSFGVSVRGSVINQR